MPLSLRINRCKSVPLKRGYRHFCHNYTRLKILYTVKILPFRKITENFIITAELAAHLSVCKSLLRDFGRLPPVSALKIVILHRYAAEAHGDRFAIKQFVQS